MSIMEIEIREVHTLLIDQIKKQDITSETGNDPKHFPL